jgi:hypothetical protein
MEVHRLVENAERAWVVAGDLAVDGEATDGRAVPGDAGGGHGSYEHDPTGVDEEEDLPAQIDLDMPSRLHERRSERTRPA